MAFEIRYVLTCDDRQSLFCQREYRPDRSTFSADAPIEPQIRHAAEADEWHRMHPVDVCPLCWALRQLRQKLRQQIQAPISPQERTR